MSSKNISDDDDQCLMITKKDFIEQRLKETQRQRDHVNDCQ